METLGRHEFWDVEVLRMSMINAAEVVVVGHAGHIIVLQVASGETLWTFALSTVDGATPCEGQPVTVGIAGEIVLAGSMGHLFGIRLNDGELLWHKDRRSRGSGETNFAFVGQTSDYVSLLER
jgi:outer membrane protein assembly factor BamB